MLNTAVAEELKQFANILEKSKDFDKDLHDLIKKTIIDHKRIIFNGNGYDDAWVKEAKNRGLLNLASTPEALPYYIHDKNIKLFTENNVYSETEIRARYEIGQENYTKIVNIEALTVIDMVTKGYLPTISKYTKELANTIKLKKDLDVDYTYEQKELSILSNGLKEAYISTELLKDSLASKPQDDEAKLSLYYRKEILPKMEAIRDIIDSLESHVSKEDWPYPTYGDLLFGVR